jgi:hypothetical protein
MPNPFLKQMGRTHHTAPMMDLRGTDERLIAHYGGIGVRTGFQVTPTAVPSRTVMVSRGVIVDPNGKEFTVGTDPYRSAQDAMKSLTADFYTVNVDELLTDAIYDGIDPAAHAILLTMDATTETFKAHKITVAEVALVAAGAVDLTSVTAGLAYFEAATVDHAARGRVSRTNPDALISATTKVATEFILAVLAKNVLGVPGVINAVTLKREKDVWVDFSALP